ncbi:hypothetical protein BKA80DRAFT_284086, partial [Phyllosticta citrichinensis]
MAGWLAGWLAWSNVLACSVVCLSGCSRGVPNQQRPHRSVLSVTEAACRIACLPETRKEQKDVCHLALSVSLTRRFSINSVKGMDWTEPPRSTSQPLFLFNDFFALQLAL